jgi:hypothetical protein
MAGIIDRSENGGRTVRPDLYVKPPRLPLGCVDCVSRVQRRSRSGRIADATRRTSRDPASFRHLDGTMSRMSMRRKAQEMRLP